MKGILYWKILQIRSHWYPITLQIVKPFSMLLVWEVGKSVFVYFPVPFYCPFSMIDFISLQQRKKAFCVRPPDFSIRHVPGCFSIVSVARQTNSTKVRIPTKLQMPTYCFQHNLEPIRMTMMAVDACHEPHAFNDMTGNNRFAYITVYEFPSWTHEFVE